MPKGQDPRNVSPVTEQLPKILGEEAQRVRASSDSSVRAHSRDRAQKIQRRVHQTADLKQSTIDV